VNVELPITEGVPEITPVVELRLQPEGSDPEVTAKVYGLIPPIAKIVVE
jgi:hypothetical protein